MSHTTSMLSRSAARGRDATWPRRYLSQNSYGRPADDHLIEEGARGRAEARLGRADGRPQMKTRRLHSGGGTSLETTLQDNGGQQILRRPMWQILQLRLYATPASTTQLGNFATQTTCDCDGGGGGGGEECVMIQARLVQDLLQLALLVHLSDNVAPTYAASWATTTMRYCCPTCATSGADNMNTASELSGANRAW